MRRPVLATLLGALTLHAAAQARAPTSPQPTFRAGTTLVEVSAIVTRDGRPVSDLRADEVTVLDNGVEQPLVAFEYVDLGSVDGPAQRRDFVLVVDDLHIHPSRTQATIGAAKAFVDALGPHDRLAAVRTASHESQMPFSTDRASAQAFISAIRGQSLLIGLVPGELEARTRAALDVIGQVAASLRSDAAERRAILLISEGHAAFTHDPSSFASREAQAVFQEFLEVLRRAALANVAIYTVDPRGLRAESFASVPSRNRDTYSAQPSSEGAASFAASPRLATDLSGSLAALAVNTGGLQAYWSNDLTRMFPRLLQDSRQYYRLAYAQPEPTPGKKQPASRGIKVKVSSEGVEVRARQRYAPVAGS